MSVHQEGDLCQGCEIKLETAHLSLRDWFHAVKKNTPNIHISWAYRDEDSQNQAYYDGKSRFKWPDSDHNYMENGLPCSFALDLFVLQDDLSAIFPPSTYSRINEFNEENYPNILWGGKYPTLRDFDHFYLKSG